MFCPMQFLDQPSDPALLVNQELNMQKYSTKHYSASHFVLRLLRESGDFSTNLYQAYTSGHGLLWLARPRSRCGSEVCNAVSV